MKKILSVLLVLTFLIVGCSNNNNSSNYIKQEYITLQQFEEKLNKKETFAFVVASRTCSHCKALKEMLKTYPSDKTIYLFEVQDASKEDISKLQTKYPGLNSTPTTFFFESGELKDTEVGYSKDSITAKLNKFFK